MTVQVTWENQLIDRAFEALASHQPFDFAWAEPTHLDNAYEHCKEVTYEHSRTFYTASALLPHDERRAMRALYAFCRVSDDLVDNATDDPRPALQVWRRDAFSQRPKTDDLVSTAWADARSRYNIPMRYGEQLLDGVARDVSQKRYETFAELTEYCYGVASTVGLMAMHITGYEGREAIPYAIKLGVALQLTNILRDVGDDWRIGRIYLPLEDLHTFQLTEDDVAAGIVDDRWRNFMAYQIARTRQLYTESLPGIAMLGKKGRFAVAAAAELYRAILTDIERNDYNNFTYRAHLDKQQKLKRLPGIYWRSRRTGYSK
jgi:phytoene synthase